MPIIQKYLTGVLLLISLFSFSPVKASHLAGGGMTYVYLGDSSSYHRYRVTLTIYEDCKHGLPDVIAQDNPAYLAVYEANALYNFVRADSVQFLSSVSEPGIIIGPCGAAGIPLCILRKTFIINYAFPNNANGYVINYQRCCHNSTITNIADPSNNGATYSCTIPATTIDNNSAIFKNSPQWEIAINTNWTLDCSATDADGDSLSYELCTAYNGASQGDSKPWPPTPPPFTSVSYVAPLSYNDPMNCSVPLQIDPVTGMLSGTPNQAGLYLVSVCCHEWRNGILINTISRETEIEVTSNSALPYKPYAGPDVTLIVGETYQFNAYGAATYFWTPGTYLSNQNIPNPVGLFTDPGKFTYILFGTSDSGCKGNDMVTVTVLPHSSFAVPNAFTPNGPRGNNLLMPIPIGNSTLKAFRIFNRWGNEVYFGSTNDQGWDGTYKGKKQDMGTFYWELEYVDSNGKTQRMKGDVILIR